MFTLIKREIEDHLAYFIGAIFISAMLTVILASVIYYSEAADNEPFFLLAIPTIIIMTIGFSSMGVSQMYTDKNRKISTFLSSLPVTRCQILTARIITGILAILIVFLPVTITVMFLMRIFAPPIPIFTTIIPDIFVVILLMAFSCYCLGLQAGWTSSRITPTLGGIVLTCIFVPLILVKGFGTHIKVILVLFIIASLTRIWQKFKTTAL
jgi:hypothetical protein